MLTRLCSRFLMLVPWLCTVTFLSISFLPTPASAITESDKGTVVQLPDDAYRVPKPFLYEVQGNDNLHWLAARFYGDPRQWVRILQANEEKLRNPNVLSIGQQLLIPANP
jgi:nucleoid-associated protein YgaU